ncbi:MAG: hypothetical protein IKQ90_00810 [Ruminococcus sp.]|nr:hypothetical protein [Ruminococcus sp.]
MKKNDIFKHISDEDAERIAAEYPTGDKVQRERMFREVEKRVSSGYSAGDEVRGVEKYRPGIAMKIVSAAAAVTLIAGAAAAGTHFLSRSSRPADSLSASETVQSQPEEEPVSEAITAPDTITEEEILEKIYSRDYTAFDRINMTYREDRNGVSFMDGVIKRDGLTGNESEMQTWTHTPEYFRDIDEDMLARDNTTPEELAKISTHNETFFVNDLLICIYSNTSDESPDVYEITDRNLRFSDDSTAFTYILSEYYIRDYIEHFDIQDITENTTFLGRECTDVFMRYDGTGSPEIEEADDVPQEPAMAPEEGEETVFNTEPDQELYLTIDNETGIILRAKLIYNGEYYEEFEVTELLFGDDAELPENGEYIRNRIAGCEPVSDMSSYDLSVLD